MQIQAPYPLRHTFPLRLAGGKLHLHGFAQTVRHPCGILNTKFQFQPNVHPICPYRAGTHPASCKLYGFHVGFPAHVFSQRFPQRLGMGIQPHPVRPILRRAGIGIAVRVGNIGNLPHGQRCGLTHGMQLHGQAVAAFSVIQLIIHPRGHHTESGIGGNLLAVHLHNLRKGCGKGHRFQSECAVEIGHIGNHAAFENHFVSHGFHIVHTELRPPADDFSVGCGTGQGNFVRDHKRPLAHRRNHADLRSCLPQLNGRLRGFFHISGIAVCSEPIANRLRLYLCPHQNFSGVEDPRLHPCKSQLRSRHTAVGNFLRFCQKLQRQRKVQRPKTCCAVRKIQHRYLHLSLQPQFPVFRLFAPQQHHTVGICNAADVRHFVRYNHLPGSFQSLCVRKNGFIPGECLCLQCNVHNSLLMFCPLGDISGLSYVRSIGVRTDFTVS